MRRAGQAGLATGFFSGPEPAVYVGRNQHTVAVFACGNARMNLFFSWDEGLGAVMAEP